MVSTTSQRRLTSKGQVTIPVEIRELLSLHPRDRVQFVVDGNQVRIEKATSVVDRYYGIARDKGSLPSDAREADEMIEEEMAREVVNETGAS